MSSVLQKIVDHKKLELEALKKIHSETSLHELIEQQSPCRGFTEAIAIRVKEQQNAVIAECKKASPSQGVIRQSYHAATLASAYEKAGATCLSVLTDEYFFQGKQADLEEARTHSLLPIIRKDFMIDPLHILQSRAMGADCILLIVAALGRQQLDELFHCAMELGIDVLVETHNSEEIEIANRLSPPLLGINNRNLHTFEVDLHTTIKGKDSISPESIIVTESGIKTHSDVQMMNDHNIFAFLIGESLLRQPNPAEALEALFSTPP